MGPPRRHVFVCVQSRPPGGRPACGARGGAELLAALREITAGRPELWDVAVTGCECLGPCFDGPNAVVYPDAVWYAGVGADDAVEVAEQHLAGGRPVARLVREGDPWDAEPDPEPDAEPGQ